MKHVNTVYGHNAGFFTVRDGDALYLKLFSKVKRKDKVVPVLN
jgi:hypothetical protein